MNKKIPFAGPSITQFEIDCVIDGVKNGFYENFSGYIKKLEKEVCEYTGTKYSIATHSCTLALHSACMGLGLQRGDEVICTDLSWAATSFAIDYTEATPVFVDIDPDTWCISPEAIEKAITKDTKAIMLVHMFGHPAKMDEIMRIANKYNLKIIEDAAPSLGATFKGKQVGSFGDYGCFSFHGAKLAVSGQGGILVTNDEELYRKAYLFSNMGRTNTQADFWCDIVGHQHSMANVTAALAYAQVKRIDELIEIKHNIFNWYKERLENIKSIKLITQQENCFSTYCYPSLLLSDNITIKRREILNRLENLNIHCRGSFPRMSRFPMHEQRFKNPIASKVEEKGMNLPSPANMTEEDVDFICESLIKIIRRG